MTALSDDQRAEIVARLSGFFGRGDDEAAAAVLSGAAPAHVYEPNEQGRWRKPDLTGRWSA